ncbi:L-amino acid N-acyltransferase YncA [Aeromicrobium sp. SORGH_AS981]|uniref:GNAT family N-acetyltransferase n=1 Tax=Aeromicrobium sp. SORGH_AS_0981 TaxID=3041802 RepID=UPI002855FE22|nr:N-acetyltransferase family protein [Aeromicrobium sp. SORGH_AS_0981]MDR6118015.1 L-amino acid N-acyltransferase YncA [Aeromicrobium sp. SORGH_AS_0981]
MTTRTDSSSDIGVRPMVEADWPDVERIWAAGIATGDATFESATSTWDEFAAGRPPGHRHVAVGGGTALGWVACSPTSSRAVYAGVVEHSVYVAPDAQGRGVGSLLLDALVASTEAAGIWTVQSSVFPENEASLRLHLRHGFRVVGHRERIGRAAAGPAAGRWRDTLLVERRSDVVGT